MVKQALVGGMVMVAALLGSAGVGRAEVNFDIGVQFGSAPAPDFVPVPSSPVEYAPAVDSNLFRFGGRFYLFSNGGWFVSAGLGGPWMAVGLNVLPAPILAVPVQYYRVPPPEWAHWRHEAPPQWHRRWDERRWDERQWAKHYEERPVVRPVVHKEPHHEPFRPPYHEPARPPHPEQHPRDDRR